MSSRKLFAKDRYDLVLVARSAEKLSRFAAELQSQFGVSVKCVPLDLTDPASPETLLRQMTQEGIRVEILVNNAGYGVFGEFEKISAEQTLGQIQLNIASLTHLTKLFLTPMVERRSGRDSQCGVHGRISSRPTDGRLLRHEGVCDFLLRGAGERT